ncbi:MAG: ATP-binding protein [Fibrobacter sp.]|nr:ATP-binding protein [Fibrobacter sp.]
MLYRKIQKRIEEYFSNGSNKVLIIEGARQIGKSFIIRYMGQKHFSNFIELNLLEDSQNTRLFSNIQNTEDFYLHLSMFAGDKMGSKKDTLVFLDEIQECPHLLTLLKFLKQEDRFTYIASGSLLGVTLSKTSSIPMGSIETEHMYPLDFEEFLLANGFNEFAINGLKNRFLKKQSLDDAMHDKVMDLFKKYLLVGGLPDAVNTYVQEKNIVKIRKIQKDIHDFYAADASKYDNENKLKIRRIYDLIPSMMENKKKRLVANKIEAKNARLSKYEDEFEYLINAGIALDVSAITDVKFPLVQSTTKNLLKLYLNDVGILTGILYGTNISAIMDSIKSINLGAVYETVVANELKAHGKKLYYYDNRHKGEVDFLIDDFNSLSVVPIEVKSGKDYTIHSALNNLQETGNVKTGIVLSNNSDIIQKRSTLYLPVYFVMFL